MTAMPQQDTRATPTTTTELPIYQRLLDESDQATRETVIAQQGEGRPSVADATDSDDDAGRHR